MLEHLLALREALARGETPDASGICSYVADRAGEHILRISSELKPRWINWPERRDDLMLDWPVAGLPFLNESEKSPQSRWSNPRRLSLLNHLIQEFSNETDL